MTETLEGLLTAANAAVPADPRRALELAVRALGLARAQGDQAQVGHCLLVLGLAHHRLGEPGLALQEYEAAGAAFARGGDERGRAQAAASLGRANRDLGDLVAARAAFESSARLAENAGAAGTHADALNGLAGILHAQGNQARSLELLLRTLELRRRIGDYRGEANCLTNLGLIHTGLSDYPRAIEYLVGAHKILHAQVQDPRAEAACLVNLGLVFENLGDHGRAVAHYSDGMSAARRAGDRVTEITALVNLANVFQVQERLNEAQQNLQTALELSRQIGFRQGEVNALLGIAAARDRQHDRDGALDAHRKALAIAEDVGDLEAQARTILAVAGVQVKLGRPRDALVSARRALDIAAGSGLKKQQSEAHERLAEAHQAARQFEKALECHIEFHRLEREIFSEQAERRSQVLAVQFEVEKAHREADFHRMSTEVERRAREEAEAAVRERTDQLEAAQREIVSRLAVAGEYRDDRTGEHTRRVGSMSARLAQELGWAPDEVELLRQAARLHDIGKIGTPDAVLLKAGHLTLAEFETIEHHTSIGARILSGGRSRLLQMAEEIALSHHERWDGTGYPRRLAGDAIPLAGRIVAVADVFDALTTQRPYKRAWSVPEALAEIERGRGRHFDPAVVDAAARVLAGEPPVVPDADDGFADPVTGLGNRRAFDADLEAELLQAARRSQGAGLLLLELDAPDGLAGTLGLSLRERLRPSGRVYRLGGSAFAAVLSTPDGRPALEAALAVAGAAGLRAAGVRASLAVFPDDGSLPHDLERVARGRLMPAAAPA